MEPRVTTGCDSHDAKTVPLPSESRTGTRETDASTKTTVMCNVGGSKDLSRCRCRTNRSPISCTLPVSRDGPRSGRDRSGNRGFRGTVSDNKIPGHRARGAVADNPESP